MKEPPQTALHTNTTHTCMCTHELVHTRIHTSHTSSLLLFLLITSSLVLLYASENQKLTLGLGKTKVWQDCFGGRIPPLFSSLSSFQQFPIFLGFGPYCYLQSQQLQFETSLRSSLESLKESCDSTGPT